jgi:hypothetical protein
MKATLTLLAVLALATVVLGASAADRSQPMFAPVIGDGKSAMTAWRPDVPCGVRTGQKTPHVVGQTMRCLVAPRDFERATAYVVTKYGAAGTQPNRVVTPLPATQSQPTP